MRLTNCQKKSMTIKVVIANDVEMILLDNNDKSVTYEVRNHDKNIKIDNITVNKHDKSYVLESGKKIDNQFVSSTYRVILKCLEDGKYPKSYANGWG